MKHKNKIIGATIALLTLGLTPSVVRAYTVNGPSMAPTLWLGDPAVTLLMAYDLKVPYTDRVLLQTGSPQPGDVILYHDEAKNTLAFKRIVGLPHDTVVLKNNVVYVNGNEVIQNDLPLGDFADVPTENDLGEKVVTETLGQQSYRTTYSPDGRGLSDHGPVVVPEGQYFILGDHRDNSADSRYIGCIRRDQIKGRVIYGPRNN